MRRPAFLLTAPALLLALALGLSACGDDDPEPTAGDPGSPTASAGTPSPSETPTPSATPSAEPTTAEPTTSEPTATPTEEPPSTPDPAGGGPTTYAEAQARFDALGQEPQQLDRFITATGTYCLLGEPAFARTACELERGGVEDPELCGDGPNQRVGRVELLDRGPTPACNTDTIREGGATKVGLDVVATSAITGVQCLVESIGVTCIDPAAGDGFFLGANAYTLF